MEVAEETFSRLENIAIHSVRIMFGHLCLVTTSLETATQPFATSPQN